MRRKLTALLAAVLLLICLPLTAAAHSGRTDANGGHKDNKNKSGLGSYHYHCGGHPAHLHPDGVCPYDTDYEEPEPEPEIHHVDSVTIHCDRQEALPGENFSAKSEISPSDAVDGAVTWSSSNPEVAAVSSDGTIETRSPGTAVITAFTANGASDSFELTVNSIEVESVMISGSVHSVTAGQKLSLTAAVTPKNATNPKLAWSSSDPAVAAVDAGGSVSALSPGEAVITAAAGNGVKAEYTIAVTQPLPEEIVISTKAPADFYKGDSFSLNYEILPENASVSSVTFTSFQEEIVTVDDKGLVTAHAPGTAAVTIACQGAAQEIQVEVKPVLPDSIEISETDKRLKVGESLQLDAVITPEHADDKSVSWSVDDDSLAQVENGRVTALKSGTVTVTATAVGGKEASIQLELYTEFPLPLVMSAGTLLVAGAGAGGYFLFRKRKH